MLHLQSATPPEWAQRAATHLDTILLDHAHLEKKAAQMALTLLYRYPERSPMLRPLSALAREELASWRGGWRSRACPRARTLGA